MLFFSPLYIFIFLPLCIYLYFIFFKNIFYKKLILLIFSVIFYSYWNINYLPLIIFSIVINFWISKILNYKNINRKLILWLGIFFNITLLTLFKYSEFIIENLNQFFLLNLFYFEFEFPLAISFFTFQAIIFLINCYDQEIIKVKFLDYSLFIFYFPQLVAGPIVKYTEMIPQFTRIIKFNLKTFNYGLMIFFIGFIKKIVLADSLGIYVDEGFKNILLLNFFSSWLLSFAFTFQFYFDFSGYVDMAIGASLMMHIYLPKNFNSPFKSRSIIDFWHRWHITLSNFLNNFVLIPLLRSFSQINHFNSMLSILFVFTLAGLWHGPSWNFLFFGIIHGVGLIINHSYRKFINLKVNKIFSIFLTFNFVNISFLMFRSETLDQFFLIFKKMFSFQITSIDNFDLNYLLLISFSFIICFYFNNINNLIKKKL